MKKQILMLIIGILIGAIITTGVFLVLKGNTQEQDVRMNRGDRMEMEELPSMDGNEINGGRGGARPYNKGMQGDTNTTDSEV